MKIINKISLMIIKYFYDIFHFGIIIAHYNFWGEFCDFSLIKGKLAEKITNKRHDCIYSFLTKRFNDLILEYKNVKTNKKANEKRIWTCWWQGLENAPLIVKKCIESMNKTKGDYELIIITKDNYKEYTDIPSDILEKVEKGIISFTHFSDILRMNLLKKHGGVWVDSTLYFFDNVFKEVDNKEFFTTKTSTKKKQWTGFFIGGNSSFILFSFVYDFLIEYNRIYNKLINYFLIDFAIDIAYDNFVQVSKTIDSVNIINSELLQLQNNINEKYNANSFNHYTEKYKFFKLSYKNKLVEKNNKGELTNYGYIINK